MRMLIGVTNCHKAVYPAALVRDEPPNNAHCQYVSRTTWINDATAAGIDVKFFFGRGGTRAPEADEVFLDADDTYDGLIDKVRAMCNWARNQGYDFLMKVDIDSYVQIQNLLMSEFRAWDYTGRGWGLGYVLSRKAMELVANAKIRQSWAEDSHALRTLFAYGDEGPQNVIRLYGDGRYCFLPNFADDNDIDLYDTSFIVANPMTPKSMVKLHETKSLRSLVPFDLGREDLWTREAERMQHCSVFDAFTVYGEVCPIVYSDWKKLTPYERQPYIDWKEIVHACQATKQLSDCPSFEIWMGPIAERKKLMEWAVKVNTEAAKKVQVVSQKFRDYQDMPADCLRMAAPSPALADVTILITTFLRDGYLFNCLSRIKTNLPECKVVVVDDGYPAQRKDGFANYMPFDSGLSAKRNRGAKLTATKYLLLGSDDFDFGTTEARAGIIKMVEVLNNDSTIDVAGGRVNNVPYEGMLQYQYGDFIKEHRALTKRDKPTQVDLLVNYFLARTEVVRQFPWPNEMKIGGEHVCFFLDLKLAGRKVVHVPYVNVNTMDVVGGADPRYDEFRGRARSLGHALMKKRYNIKDYIDFSGELS